MKRFLLYCILAVCLEATAQTRPNIIFIMSDDHDEGAISAYRSSLISTPNIDRLAKEGMRFTRCFVGNSICGPSRATLLTGQHSHLNRFKTNRDRFDSSLVTLPHLLRNAGYQTAMIGKWHLVSYPTGFGYWSILPGQGQYYQPRFISMKGDTTTRDGYATDLITSEAINWLRAAKKNQPFALFLHHKAPHRNFMPAPRHLSNFNQRKFPEPSTLYADMIGRGTAWQLQTMTILRDLQLCSDLKVNPKDLEDLPGFKPSVAEIKNYEAMMNRVPVLQRDSLLAIYATRGQILRDKKPAGKALLQLKYQWYMQDYLACVASVDENVGRVLDEIDQAGLRDNTLIIYTSDQGMFLGENGWYDKRWMYDYSMQTPFLVRWPSVIPRSTVQTAMVQNIDWAPTLLAAAGVSIPNSMQGLSMLDLLRGTSTQLPREYIYYHFYEYRADHTVLPHYGIRGTRYKLIYFYTVNEWELYDLAEDPREQRNLSNSPSHQQLLLTLKEELKRQRTFYQDNEENGDR